MTSKRKSRTRLALVLGAALAPEAPSRAQEPDAPAAQSQSATEAEGTGDLPEITIEQAPAPAPKPVTAASPKPKAKPQVQQYSAPAPKKKPSAPQKAKAAPVPAEPIDADASENVADAPPQDTRDAVDGRVSSAARPSASPVQANSLVPKDVQNFAGAATRIDTQQLDAQRPLSNHDALARVPGIVTVTDDGLGRHSGIGIRGSNFRRSRKVLVMEDGVSINFSSYLDPSTHYTPPGDRVENIEVIRGTVVSHGPLNNHGIVNFQNLSPFGKEETVIKGALSHTEGAGREIGNYRHVHTRQHHDNVGAVISYSGAEAPGAWEIERLRYNDIYGALGWKGTDQDLTVSGVYFRQRDNYDEDNFLGSAANFFANGHNKPSALLEDEGFRFNTYNAEQTSLQVAHNYYFDADTTLSTRIYGKNHDRRRFSSRDDGPSAGGFMRGRERDYEVYGTDSRLEFANLPFIAGMWQDIQVGVRFERHKLTNCTSFGKVGAVLDGSTSGNCRAEGPEFPDDGSIDIYRADSIAAFVQSAIHVTRDLTITPGLRFENYDVSFRREFPTPAAGEGTASSDHTHVLPGIGFAWETLPQTTLYGGYHRGFAPHIVRDVDPSAFPLAEEIGDNFQVGIRSQAMRGMTFDVAYFHSFIDDYQTKESFSNDRGDGVYGLLDEVEISGVEASVRVESQPFTGGAWNLFGEAMYTYTDGRINRGTDAIFEDLSETNVAGNTLPFTVQHFANLTVGVAYRKLWDASLTWTYRGAFFTNAQNNTALTCIDEDGGVDFGCTGGDLDELVGGKVDDVWLLSARANLHVSDQLSLYLAGNNLADELYIAELSDGAKPGLGRTIYGGFTLRFD
ncbi:MAG: TonB-dependent receptor domain-containing protein [Hyphomicrobium sp.]